MLSGGVNNVCGWGRGMGIGVFVGDRFSQYRGLVKDSGFRGLRGYRVTIFNVNNINKCMIRTLTHTNINGVSLVSGSAISVAGVGHRVVTLRSAINRLGISMVGGQMLSVGPGVGIGAFPLLFLPRGSTDFSFGECSCIISTISGIATGLRLILGYGRTGAPVVSTVNAKGGLSTGLFRVASVCGASIYPLTGIVQCRLGGHNIGGLGILCSGRVPVGGRGGPHAPVDVDFIPSITKLLVTNRIVGSVVGWGRPFNSFLVLVLFRFFRGQVCFAIVTITMYEGYYRICVVRASRGVVNDI